MIIFGTNYAGKIEKLGDQSLKTRFFHIFWLPIIPIGGFFITGVDDEGEELGFEAKMNSISILSAYIRRYLFFAIFVLSIMIYDNGFKDFILIGILAACAIAWIVSMFFLGKLSENHRFDRMLLGLGSGISASPSFFKNDVASKILSGLEENWKEREEGKDWHHAFSSKNTDSSNIPLLYSIARYSNTVNESKESSMYLEQAYKWAQQTIPSEELEHYYEAEDEN